MAAVARGGMGGSAQGLSLFGSPKRAILLAQGSTLSVRIDIKRVEEQH